VSFDELTEAYDEYVLEKYLKKEDRERPQTFRTSDLGTCHRRMVLKLANVEGRAMTPEKRRFFRHRTILHDDYLRGLRARGRVVIRELDVTPGLPDGFSGHLDAIVHSRTCGCGLGGRGALTILWATMAKQRLAGDERWRDAAAQLVAHEYRLIDAKTTHPNIVNYTDSLPKPHNVQQVRGYEKGFRGMFPGFDWELKLSVVYIPMGEGKMVRCDIPAGDTDWVDREMWALTLQWNDYCDLGLYPAPLLIELKDKKEGPHRVIFRVTPWQCSEQYCPYCRYASESADSEEAVVCEPSTPQTPSGDRIAYLEPDGSWTYIKKWLKKLGEEPPEGAAVEDGPRPKEGCTCARCSRGTDG